MKNRLIAGVLVCLLALCALCGASAEVSGVDPAAAMAAYKAVLRNEMPFHDFDQDMDLTLDGMEEPYLPLSFALVDMDGDKVPELILALGVEDDPYIGREVLTYANGVVTGYQFDYRAMISINAAGTYSASSGASDNEWLTIAFTEDGYEETALIRSESTEDGGVRYFLGEDEVSEADYSAALELLNSTPEVTWYTFADIDMAFAAAE